MFNHRTIIPLVALLLFAIVAISIQLGIGKVNRNLAAKIPQDVQSTDISKYDSIDFPPLPNPGPDDWLANHHENGQTVDEFINGPRNEISESRKTIYLLPMGEFDKQRSPSLELLRKYTELFFSVNVKILPAVKLSINKFSPRINPYTRKMQLHAGEILSYLIKNTPEDAYCILGITMVDLYPDPEWNFVFGLASYEKRAGVFSFARFTPEAYNGLDSSSRRLILIRSCKVITHETGHMFGLAHCIAYHCNMNGCNTLVECDAQPVHLCPLCLKKLQCAVVFNTKERFISLGAFYSENGYQQEAQWVQRRLVTSVW